MNDIYELCACGLNYINVSKKEKKCKICLEKKNALEVDFTKPGIVVVKDHNGNVKGTIEAKSKGKPPMNAVEFAIKHPFQGGAVRGK